MFARTLKEGQNTGPRSRARLRFKSPLKDEPFFHPLVLLSVLVFALNNFWWKASFHNWWTGKLSDFCFCLFAPLYGALLLRLLRPWSKQVRLIVATSVTIIVFSAVKMSPWFSTQLHDFIAPAGIALFGVASTNVVDNSDLLAVPMAAFVCWYFSKRRYARD